MSGFLVGLSTPPDYYTKRTRKILQSLKMGGLISIIHMLQNGLSLLFDYLGWGSCLMLLLTHFSLQTKVKQGESAPKFAGLCSVSGKIVKVQKINERWRDKNEGSYKLQC